MEFNEVSPGVLVLRYPVLDVNASLILGDAWAVVVDTLSTSTQAATLVSSIRVVTKLPLIVVNTHHHFDHCFGNSAFPTSDIWAHETTAAHLREHPQACVRQAFEEFGAELGMDALADVKIVPPNRFVRETQRLDLGGRVATLHHLGRGHTAGDVVVTVDGTVIAGDLVEEGSAPSFKGSYPLEWPETLAAVVDLCGDGPIVPGHGAVVDKEFVAAQHARLADLDWLIREGHADGVSGAEVAARAATDWDLLSGQAALLAVRRGYAELSGVA